MNSFIDIIIDQLIFLEFSQEPAIDEDLAVQQTESIVADLEKLNKTDLDLFVDALNSKISSEKNNDIIEFLIGLKETFE